MITENITQQPPIEERMLAHYEARKERFADAEARKTKLKEYDKQRLDHLHGRKNAVAGIVSSQEKAEKIFRLCLGIAWSALILWGVYKAADSLDKYFKETSQEVTTQCLKVVGATGPATFGEAKSANEKQRARLRPLGFGAAL